MSTYDKLDTINDSLNDIKTAIIAKGQTPSGDITTYATAIDNIETGGGSNVKIDNSTITKNSSDEIQAVGLVNQNTDAGATTSLQLWNGTQEQWNTGGGTATFYQWTNVEEVSSADYWPYPYDSADNAPVWRVASNGQSQYVAICPGTSLRVCGDFEDGGYDAGTEIGNNPLDIFYLENKYVALPMTLSPDAYLYYSEDGVNWDNMQMMNINEPIDVLFYNKTDDGMVFAISSMSNTVYYTENGSFWFMKSTMFPIEGKVVSLTGRYFAYAHGAQSRFVRADGMDFQEMIFMGATYDAVSNVYAADGTNAVILGEYQGDKIALYSSDLLTWQSSVMPNYTYTSLVSSDGKFVALVGNKVVYSTNHGVSWSEATISSSHNYGSIHYCGNKFVVMGTNYVAYSYDLTHWVESYLPNVASYFTYSSGSVIASTDNAFMIVPLCPNQPTGEPTTPHALFVYYYTNTDTPTTSSQVYSAPNVSSALTIASTGTGTITLSDTKTYTYITGGESTVSSSVGQAHPNYICNINNVGVKIGNTVIAEKNSSSGGWTGMFNAEGGRMIHVENGLIVRVEPDF